MWSYRLTTLLTQGSEIMGVQLSLALIPFKHWNSSDSLNHFIILCTVIRKKYANPFRGTVYLNNNYAYTRICMQQLTKWRSSALLLLKDRQTITCWHHLSGMRSHFFWKVCNTRNIKRNIVNKHCLRRTSALFIFFCVFFPSCPCCSALGLQEELCYFQHPQRHLCYTINDL